MLVFGVDVPLVEVIFAFAIIIFILFIEAVIVIGLLIKQMNKTKQLSELIEKMSETILAIKKVEIEELDRIRRR
jgi:hypothetical protein